MKRLGLVLALAAIGVLAVGGLARSTIFRFPHEYAGTYTGQGETRHVGTIKFEISRRRLVRDFTFRNIDYTCNGLYVNVHRYQLRDTSTARRRDGLLRFFLRDVGSEQGVNYEYRVRGRIKPEGRTWDDPVGFGTLFVSNSFCPEGRRFGITFKRTTREYIVP